MNKQEVKIEKRERGFSDKLDVLKYVADIKLRLNKDITADFALAKLGIKDKEAIIEMTCNAYYSKYVIGLAKRNCQKIGLILSKEDLETIEECGNRIFDQYMNRIYMTVILNKNVDGNYLINVLSDYGRDREEIPLEETNESTLKKVAGEQKSEDNKK